MLDYYKNFVKTFWKDFRKSTREQVIGALLVIAILLLQIHYGVIKPGEIQPNVKSIAWPYVALVGAFFILHLIRAPWKLHQDQERGLSEANRQLELEKDKSGRLQEQLERLPVPKIFLHYELPEEAKRFSGVVAQYSICGEYI